jgi:hypothetical protein
MEEAPITSPIVLIEKRMKSSEPKANDRNSSLREYCFCVDYQYINSQSETFIYNMTRFESKATQDFVHEQLKRAGR